ncbi:hypothetical protein [Mediterraneibacter faecis]|uniref:hypothetical protein n=1 Tax=Mediterraneibacter faecis TaxID=592978 RepID=UPI001D061AC1|nr:hypothetical protein [Mediterraneibacter faecis]MCB7327200.1 hypothetical protein [Mediterraneibacter faecis]
MESYVERWKREQEEKEQKGVGKNGRRTEEAQNEREGQKAQNEREGQKAQKDRGVSEE